MRIDRFAAWIGGFLMGGVIGGYFMGVTCANRYRDQIRELETLVSSKREEDPEKPEEKSEEEPRKNPTPTYTLDNWRDWAKDYETALTIIEMMKPKTVDKIKYEKLSKQYSNEEFDKHFEDRAHPDDDDAIYVIDKETFDGDLEMRDFEKMTYYQAENILVDEVGDIVYDEVETLSQEAVDILNVTEEDTVYVLNETENRMYEVTVDHISEFNYNVPDFTDFSDTAYRDELGGT